jgi:hypothetical protein
MAISHDHRRSLISGPAQTLISAGSSLAAVYYLVRAGGLELLGLWSIGNLVILYGSAMALGVHQVVARDLATDRVEQGVDALTHYARLVWCIMAGAVLLLLVLCVFLLQHWSILVGAAILVAAAGVWVLATLAKGPVLFLRRLS